MSAQPTPDLTTPRPWYWDNVMGGIRVFDHYVVIGGGFSREPTADDHLILRAVNDYDRLLAVEAAARDHLDAEAAARAAGEAAVREKGAAAAFATGHDPLDVALAAFQVTEDRLRAALARPAEEERG